MKMRLIGKSMNMFDSFRGENGFTLYPDHESPNFIDKNLVIVTYFSVLVAVATLLATLGVRGKDKWFGVIRASYSVAVGSIILACIVSHSWKEGQAQVVASPYVYRADLGFNGVVGLKIGLHSANVTLQGSYRGYSGELHHVDYVEKVEWADYGEERESYKPLLHRGLPEPILKVMDFLTICDGGMRWGTAFHSAGQIACALLWTAFAFWLLTNVLLFSVIIYGAYTFFLTGLALLMACVAFHSGQNDYPFYILYGDNILELTYGWSFWLTLVTGACTTAMGTALILMDHFLPDTVADFFHLEKPFTEEPQDDCRPNAVTKASTNMGLHRLPNNSYVSTNSAERKGSIFLEPSRRDNNMSVPLFPKVVVSSHHHPESSPFVNKAFEGDSSSKMNPFYLGDKVFDFSEERLRLAEMEKVCEKGPFHLNDPKASLATLKELRDNHANERKSTSFSNAKDSVEKSDKTSSSSLQSSTLPPRPNSDSADVSRPRSKSDGATLGELSQRRNSSTSSSAVFDLEAFTAAHENSKTDDYYNSANRAGNLNQNQNDPRLTSQAVQETGMPNQVEVEVETHHPSVSDIDIDLVDPHPSPNPTTIADDPTDALGIISIHETEAKSISSNQENETNVRMSADDIPHSTTKEITIQIEPC